MGCFLLRSQWTWLDLTADLGNDDRSAAETDEGYAGYLDVSVPRRKFFFFL